MSIERWRRAAALPAAAAVLVAGLVAGCTGKLGADGEPSAPDEAGAGDIGQGPGGPEADGGGGGLDGSDLGGSRGDMGVPPSPVVTDPNLYEQDALFVCDGAPASSPGRLRRMDRDAWVRNVGRRFDTRAGKNPLDPYPTHHYKSYVADETLDPSALSSMLDVVSEASAGWKGADGQDGVRLKTVKEEASLRCFFDEAEPDDACVDNFVGYLLERGVLFRPSSDEEFDALRQLTQKTLDAESALGESRHDTIEHIISAAWLTSGALFHREMGQGAADEHGRYRLGPWETAHALASALDHRAPGSPGVNVWPYRTAEAEGHLPGIVTAAADGTIVERETIAALVRTYAIGEDPERPDLLLELRGIGDWWRKAQTRYWVSKGIRDFFRQWLDYPRVVGIFKERPEATSAFDDPAETSDFRPIKQAYENLLTGFKAAGSRSQDELYRYEPTLVEQLDATIARIVVEDQDVLRQLLTSRRFYTPSTAHTAESNTRYFTWMANRIYNLTEEYPATEEGRWVELPQGERAGVLTHPAWLGSHGGNFENDPNAVHRGKWIREELLCGRIPPVPITVDAALDPDTRHQSARQRMAEQLDARPECAGCHKMMNPLGLPFEIYNHAGFLRIEDHGQPPSGASTLEGMPDPGLDGPVRDAVELGHKLADSPHVKRCFIRQTFRYFMGRDETPRDGCALAAMEQAYDDSDGSFVEMLVALFTSDTFLYRTHDD